jgi:hypothetical protein
MTDRSEQVPVIAVASGKGGVGKTTVAVNVALALTAQGQRTGLVAHLKQQGGRGRAGTVDVAGVENMSGQVCPNCGQTTPLFPSAPEAESIWGLIPRLASIPFSYQAARDADEGRPVMVTGAVPEQVAAYRLIAEQIGRRFTNP